MTDVGHCRSPTRGLRSVTLSMVVSPRWIGVSSLTVASAGVVSDMAVCFQEVIKKAAAGMRRTAA